jgi:hypothetical protein
VFLCCEWFVDKRCGIQVKWMVIILQEGGVIYILPV